MILSDITINKICRDYNAIEPYDKKYLNPASVDLTLGDSFIVLKKTSEPLMLDSKVPVERHDGVEQISIAPGEFLLATTREVITLGHDISAFVEGKSSIGRQGIFIQNAGFIDPGFKGQITLELYNASPNTYVLKCGMRICQIVFFKVDERVFYPYNGKYQNQRGAVESLMYKDKEFYGID